MNVLELKNDILYLLYSTNSQQALMLVRAILAKTVERPGEPMHDWWDELTPEQQADLDVAIEESFHEENLVDNEIVFKKYEKWLQ
jgi:hypothetical protein